MNQNCRVTRTSSVCPFSLRLFAHPVEVDGKHSTAFFLLRSSSCCCTSTWTLLLCTLLCCIVLHFFTLPYLPSCTTVPCGTYERSSISHWICTHVHVHAFFSSGTVLTSPLSSGRVTWSPGINPSNLSPDTRLASGGVSRVESHPRAASTIARWIFELLLPPRFDARKSRTLQNYESQNVSSGNQTRICVTTPPGARRYRRLQTYPIDYTHICIYKSVSLPFLLLSMSKDGAFFFVIQAELWTQVEKLCLWSPLLSSPSMSLHSVLSCQSPIIPTPLSPPPHPPSFFGADAPNDTHIHREERTPISGWKKRAGQTTSRTRTRTQT